MQVDSRPERPTKLPATFCHAAPQRVLLRYVRHSSVIDRFVPVSLRSILRAEFELGLELDSAEVRGVLMHEGQDWGYAVVDIRS